MFPEPGSVAGLTARLPLAFTCLTWPLAGARHQTQTQLRGPWPLPPAHACDPAEADGFGCREEVGVAEGTLGTLWGTHGAGLFPGPA